ncbi:Lrp/AsnC family transcriptional regulator, regulator for asnA, asnC and gidA [Pseudarcicella hirudinis]|uniref:Lrp/AsnC family transcriptional regulator, regulator for asnA, asnC and gidA n=1 Tax=Pseudarcicella hirudinis TaxID=1079859 RepID=A0A1I5TIX1_9BACT|nr:Lrp/AsnC family transcriptional regulator [Pseudarcicella hirudinis]SFP82821.1 Lrp/AsnC family transcriptional regulator, regulator for asnA, asnC and gidA [Pseudarcicella hirudinis]
MDAVNLDELDFSILKELQKDGRASFTEVAEKLNVSISNVRTRVTKLLDDKTIQIVGRVNPQKVGFNAYANISVSVRPAHMIPGIAQQLMEMREVSFLAITSGDFDIEVDVMCKDNEQLHQFVNQQIAKIEGVYQTKTTMYMKVYKYAQPDLDLIK